MQDLVGQETKRLARRTISPWHIEVVGLGKALSQARELRSLQNVTLHVAAVSASRTSLLEAMSKFASSPPTIFPRCTRESLHRGSRDGAIGEKAQELDGKPMHRGRQKLQSKKGEQPVWALAA